MPDKQNKNKFMAMLERKGIVRRVDEPDSPEPGADSARPESDLQSMLGLSDAKPKNVTPAPRQPVPGMITPIIPAAATPENKDEETRTPERVVTIQKPGASPNEPAAVRTEPTKPEPVKAEPVRTEPAKPEPAKPEPPVRTEPIKPAPISAAPVAPAPVVTAPTTPEPVRTEPTKPEPIKAEPVRTEPIKPEPIKPEPVRTEPIKPAPISAAPVVPVPVMSAPTTPEPVRTEPVKVEPIKVEPIKPEPIKIVEPIKPEPIKPEPIKVEQIKPELIKPEPIRPEAPMPVVTMQVEFDKKPDASVQPTPHVAAAKQYDEEPNEVNPYATFVETPTYGSPHPVQPPEPPVERTTERYLDIEELYRTLSMHSKQTDSIYLIEEYSKTLPDSLPEESRREIVAKIVAASGFDYDLLMGDGVLRVRMLKEYAERFAQHTEEYVSSRNVELEELEQQMNRIRTLIENRRELHKKQFFAIETEAQRLKEILTFISG